MNREQWLERLRHSIRETDSRSLTTDQIAALAVMFESFSDQPQECSKAPVLQLIPGGVA